MVPVGNTEILDIPVDEQGQNPFCRLAYLHGWYRCSMLEHICVCESVQCVRIQIHVPDGIAHLLVTITSCCAHNSEYLGTPHLPYF